MPGNLSKQRRWVGLAMGLVGCTGGTNAGPVSDASLTDSSDVASPRQDAPGGGDSNEVSNDSSSDAPTDGGAPACDQPDPLVAFPSGPHGLYVVEFPGQNFQQEFVPLPPYLATNPVVCGGNIVIQWSQVDHGPSDAGSQYDFTSTIEPLIAEWTAVGKKANLLVWAVGIGTNTATPQYVLDEVQSVTCLASAPGQPFVNPYPIVWSDAFVSLYKPFIAKVLATYGSDSRIGYIRFGLSTGAQSEAETCYTELLQADAGLSEGTWESYIAGIVQYQVSLPHTVPLMLGIAPYKSGGPKGDVTLPDWEAALAADAGIGIGNQGLSSADVTAGEGGTHCGADWCALFDKVHGSIPLYLQPLGTTSPDGGGAGSLASLLPFAMGHYTQIFELFDSEFQIAYDPTNPLYATDGGAAYRDALEKAASVLGSKP